MSEAVLKDLCKETKARIIVSEFEARRMPMFQMRAVLSALILNDEEKKVIIDLVERGLRATGYPAEQTAAFLSDLLYAAPSELNPQEAAENILGTRKLRSPFSLSFELPPAANAEKTVAPAAKAEAGEAPPAGVAQPHPAGTARMKAPAPGQEQAARDVSPPPAIGARRSVFSFDSPVRSAAPDAPPAPGKDWRQEAVFGKPVAGVQLAAQPTVLVADDDKRVRMIFRLRLEGLGMSVIECENGCEAWEIIQKGDVSAVVLDMKMSGLHGLEVLANMNAKQIFIPVVICSAYDQLQDDFVVKSYPLARYLVKPVVPEALIAALKELFVLKAQ